VNILRALDEFIFRQFAKGLNYEDIQFLIEEYKELAEKLKPLTVGRPKK